MTHGIVHIVDDDAAVRDSLALLCETAGFRVEGHADAEDLLARLDGVSSGCVVIDLQLPGMSGMQLHEELRRRGCTLPVVYLTAHGDIPTTVRAMKLGAVDFLAKPVHGAELLERLRAVLDSGRSDALPNAASASQLERLQRLTPREYQIMLLVVAAHSSKQIARRLGISFRTVELHRSRILNKTGAANVLELARLAAACGVTDAGFGSADKA